MADGPKRTLRNERNAVRKAVDAGDMSESCGNAIVDWSKAVDPTIASEKHPAGDEYALSSIGTYLRGLRLCAVQGEIDLSDTERKAGEINTLMGALVDGTAPNGSSKGISKSTAKRRQSALKSFYGYYTDVGIEPDNIDIFAYRSEPRHDEQDMFTRDEVNALRDGCNTPRDRAILELLINTGQRVRVIQTLRIRDVDVNADDDSQRGYIYLNGDGNGGHTDGLKGATRRGKKRPMFAARKYVRDWLEYHPRRNDPDAPLFVGDPSNPNADSEGKTPMHYSTIRSALRRVRDRAGISKPVNPHNFRHYWVTVMKRDYDLDDAEVKMLMGAAKGSPIMETTYSHVSDGELIAKAEERVGYREPEAKENPLTPDTCPVCGELLEESWKACPECGERFHPVAEAVMDATDAAEETRSEAAIEGDGDTTVIAEKVAQMIKDNPKMMEKLLNE